MSTLALVFWVVVIGVVFRVVAEQGGWSGLLTWLGTKFGPVNTSSSSGSGGGSIPNHATPGSGLPPPYNFIPGGH